MWYKIYETEINIKVSKFIFKKYLKYLKINYKEKDIELKVKYWEVIMSIHSQ